LFPPLGADEEMVILGIAFAEVLAAAALAAAAVAEVLAFVALLPALVDADEAVVAEPAAAVADV
jgi:hypothetical protein